MLTPRSAGFTIWYLRATEAVVLGLTDRMLKSVIVICVLVAAPSLDGAYALRHDPAANSTVHAAQRNDAETVFASAAPKVVFLITRKSGELHARASGVILAPDGFIATNYHALQGADAVEIRFFANPKDSEDYQSFNGAKLLFADAQRDIAVLKVTSSSLPFLACSATMGCEPRVGETVYAIGNPRGLTHTISEGIVSALRTDGGEKVIQHTASISPGSSGGALVDSNGGLLGMNSWQVTEGQNLNFAISAKDLFEALRKARQSTSALSFPPEAPDDVDISAESRAEKALRSRDYIQAINQAEQAVAAGISDSNIYTILGLAKDAQGRDGEAEQYLRQAISLAGPDDRYKQTARFLLVRILADRLNAVPASVDRPALLRLINDFLGSNSPLGDAESYNDERAWVASVSQRLRSIVGVWRGKSPSLVGWVMCEGEYILSAAPGGNFTLGFRPIASSAKDVACTVDGTLAPTKDEYAGTIIRKVMVQPPPPIEDRFGLASQQVRIEFKIADDMMTIDGTASGGEVTNVGAGGKFARDLLLSSGRPQKPWPFTLHRVQ